MKKVFVMLFGLMLICGSAEATCRRALLTWTLPTTYSNGKPLLATDIAQVNIFYAGDDGTDAGKGLVGNPTSFLTSFCVKGYYSVSVVDRKGVQGALSNMVYVNAT